MTSSQKQNLAGMLSGLALAALLLAGCSPRESVQSPAASSSIPYAEARLNAETFAGLLGPDYKVFAFADTGSMAPTMDSRTLAVAEPVATSTVLRVGDIVSFHRRDGLRVCHRVLHVEGGSVITGGDTSGTRGNDGWQRPEYRVVALFYTQ